MSGNTGLSYKKAARIQAVACGFLFSVFSFVYLFVFQKDVLEALHYSLSQGKTHYSAWIGAVVITVVLSLFRWGMNSLMRLQGPVHALSYFPACLLLGVLTDVDRTLFHGESFSDKWLWLFPLLFFVYIGVACALRRVFRYLPDQAGSVPGPGNANLAILVLLCLMAVGIGNSDQHFHHELMVEKAIRDKDYNAARRVGARSLDASRTLTVLRAYALSLQGSMGEHLFEYPQYYGADGLLFAPFSQETLRLDADSLYQYLGARRRMSEAPVDYLARICKGETGRYTALDYYLSALLLEKRLDEFASSANTCFFEQDTLPRHYREAIVLYKQSHPDYPREINDTLMMRRFEEFSLRQKEFTSPAEEKNRMRREFGDTYWWYYRYQGAILPRMQ